MGNPAHLLTLWDKEAHGMPGQYGAYAASLAKPAWPSRLPPTLGWQSAESSVTSVPPAQSGGRRPPRDGLAGRGYRRDSFGCLEDSSFPLPSCTHSSS
jgi:hypothetical protein